MSDDKRFLENVEVDDSSKKARAASRARAWERLEEYRQIVLARYPKGWRVGMDYVTMPDSSHVWQIYCRPPESK